MTPPIKVRSFTSRDLPACQTLYLEGLIGGKIAENDTALDLDDIATVYMKPGNHFGVAENERGKVVGMIGVQHHETSTAEIRRLRVAADHRRRGIGSALVEAALKFCQENHYIKITHRRPVRKIPYRAAYQKYGKSFRSRNIADLQ